nr:hypothetical protein [Enterobacter cancerogenus]
MLLPVFVCDGQNLHRASTRAAHSCSASHIRSTFHDGRRKHSRATENSGASRHQNDYALCLPSTRPS